MKIKGMKKPEMVVDSGCGLVDKWPAGHMKSEEVHYSYFSEENGSTITTLISLKAAESLISKELTLST